MSDVPPGGSVPPDPTPPPQSQPAPAPQSWNAAPDGAGTAAAGLDPKVGGLLSYLLFGWIGGLIMYLTQKHPEVRFHGAQSILYSIALVALWIAVSIVSVMLAFISSALASIFSLVTFVLWLGSIAVWILLCVKGYNLEHFKLPVIGDIAEKWATK